MTNKRVLRVFTLNCLQTGHWVRIDYYIVMNWTHVSVTVQCQSDGCSLSSKDGAVVWQPFGQLAVSPSWKWRLMIAAAPTLFHSFWSHRCKFIMWSLCFTILIEFSLGFFSGDHTFAHSSNEVVSLGIVIMRSWWKAGCTQGADQFGIDLCRGNGCLYLETKGRGRRLVMPPLLFGRGHADL